MKKKLIAIVGPTAAGKTSLGIAVAKQFNGEVISVDSRQIFRGMDIGTGKEPGEWIESDIEKGGGIEQLYGARKELLIDGVVHWGIDIANPDQVYSAAEFKEYAEQKIEEIMSRGHVPVLAGGTGFWLKAIVENLDLGSVAADDALRVELEARPIGDLFAEYKRLDPEGALTIDRENKRRVVRALEVTRLTGKPFSELKTSGEPKYDVLTLGITHEREVLAERISTRVDQMVAEGLVDEVRELKETYGSEIESMTSIGYRDICKFLDGEEKLVDAIEQMKRDQRRYAKRQMTWWKRDKSIQWVSEKEVALKKVKDFLV
jgi:tRNA dimethylallyltransferase